MSSAEVTIQPKSLQEMKDLLEHSLPKDANRPRSAARVTLLSDPQGLEIRWPTSKSTRMEVHADSVAWWEGKRKIVDVATDHFDVHTRLEGQIFVIHFSYRPSPRPLAERLQAARRTRYPVFVSRALGALQELEHELAPERIEEAISAPDDFSVLLAALSDPAVVTQLTERDPLAAAKLRGVAKQQELLQSAGGAFSAEEAAGILGITRQAVDKRRRQGQLLALSQGRRGYVYPGFQFESGRAIPYLEKVLEKLSHHDSWMQCAFFVNPNSRLGNRSPVQVLLAGNTDDVLKAAASYGEQGAA